MAAGKSSTKVAQIVHVGSHTLMGIAMGLAFALITARQVVFGIREAIEQSDAPAAWMTDFATTCTVAFGVAATLTGMILIGVED
jgi:hypothetical protein